MKIVAEIAAVLVDYPFGLGLAALVIGASIIVFAIITAVHVSAAVRALVTARGFAPGG